MNRHFDVGCWMLDVRRSRANARAGFTLVELLIVIAIMGVLMGLVLGVSGYAMKKADNARAMADLEKIKNALEEYRIEYGRYPINDNYGENRSKALSRALWVKPQSDDNIKRPFLVLEGWNDEDEEYKILDPWGNEYYYIHRSTAPYADHNNSKLGYDLWSTGIDAIDEGDDISNWREVR